MALNESVTVSPLQEGDHENWQKIWMKHHDASTIKSSQGLWDRMDRTPKILGIFGYGIKYRDTLIGILHIQLQWSTFEISPKINIEDLVIEYPKMLVKEISRQRERFKASLMAALEKAIGDVIEIVGSQLNENITIITFETSKDNALAKKMYNAIPKIAKQERDGSIYYTLNV